MKLSIVIVNYNVKHFLEQCLESVFRGIKDIEAEVWVVDNNSVDGSVEMVKSKFPAVKLVELDQNLGFSKANNIALRQATGQYVVILNPDTIVEEKTFAKVIEFMDAHPEAGALGVKMVDGKGRYLPESKRSLPTPWVSFCKIFGLTSLFPRSKLFARYYLGHLSNDEIHEVEILSGAFMCVRKTVLDQIGYFDETFFIYGEDIDLSYRIILAGYKNYYFPHTQIVHFKGESTKKGSLNYVYHFYNAMRIFAKKHFSSKKINIFLIFINIAIALKAFTALIWNYFSKIALFWADIFMMFIGLFMLGKAWEWYVLSSENARYPLHLFLIGITGYSLVWMLFVYLFGGYEKPLHLRNIFKGLVVGTLVILVIYSLLPEHFRFSRALIIVGFLYVMLYFSVSRLVYHALKLFNVELAALSKKRALVLSDENNFPEIEDKLRQLSSTYEFILHEKITSLHMEKLKEKIRIFKINQIIFSSSDMNMSDVLDLMSQLAPYRLQFYFLPSDATVILGSKHVQLFADAFLQNTLYYLTPLAQRWKRWIDVLIAIIFLLLFPIALFFYKRPKQFLKNIFFVLCGKKTWVNVHPNGMLAKKLKTHRPGILSPSDVLPSDVLDDKLREQLDLFYTKNYSIWTDLQIILQAFCKLDRS